MGNGEEWRRELAEKLHPNTDWTVRPSPRPAALPIAQMIPIQEPHNAPPPRRASTDSAAAAPVDREATTVYSWSAPIVAETPHMPDERIWPYVGAALSLLAVAAGSLFIIRGEKSPVAPGTAQVAVAAAPAATSVHLESPPAEDAARCDATLAAPVLSALVRRGTAFDGQQTPAAAPATLGAVRQFTADGTTAVCRGVLELQLADVRTGSPVLQIVSGPVDYAVDGGAGASVPTFRLLRARSIVHRLATMPAAVPAAVAAAEPVADMPPVAVERIKPIQVPPPATPETVLRRTERPAAAEPLPAQRAGAATVALPVTAKTLPPRRAEIEAAAPPAADAAPEVIRPLDERAADSAAAQAVYGAIARSGDPQAIGAADEGRDLYLSESRRCSTPACAAVAYKRWLTQLRYIDERSRSYVND